MSQQDNEIITAPSPPPVAKEEMGAAVMPEDSGPALTPYGLGDTSDYDGMTVEELTEEHASLDTQRNEINARMVAVDDVRARKEWEAERAAAAGGGEAQSADAAGAESDAAVGSK